MNLILRAGQVPAIRLGQQGRLGWTTWLMPRRVASDAADLCLDVSADSHASRIMANTRNQQTGDGRG